MIEALLRVNTGGVSMVAQLSDKESGSSLAKFLSNGVGRSDDWFC